MSYNLADLPMDERRAMEEYKAELFEFWKANKDRSYGDAARIFGAKEKKGKGWRAWADLELAGMEPQSVPQHGEGRDESAAEWEAA